MGTLPFEWVGPELQIRNESGSWRMQMVEDFGRDDGVYGALLYNLRERATRKEYLGGDAARFCRIVTVFPNTAATPQNDVPPVQPLVPLIVFDPALPSEEADINPIPFLFESTKNAKNGGVAFLARCGHGIRLYLPWQDTDALEQPGGQTAEEHAGSVVLTNDLLCASMYLDPSDDPTLDFVLRQGSQGVNYLFVHIGAKAVEGGWACFGFITPAEDDIMPLLRRLGQRPPAA